MTVKIDADTSSGLQLESDTSGIIDIQSAGVTKMTVGTTIDIQGNELVLDADGDTSIHADTDDQIDFKTAGVDRMRIDASGNVTVGGNALLTASASIGTSNNSNGYILFDNTLLINWVRKSSTSTQTITFPLAFTNYYGVYHGTETAGGAYLRIHSLSTTSVTVGSGGANVTGWVLAFGRKT